MELVLNTYGTALNRDSQCFVISNDNGRKRIPLDGVTSIMVGKGVTITSDAVLLAIDNGVEIRFLDRRGNPQGLIWSHRYGSISNIRKGQLEFSKSPKAVEWIKGIISKKIENQQAMLLMITPADESIAASLDHCIALLEKLRIQLLNSVEQSMTCVAPQLRGIEGMASKKYFEALNLVIPEQYRFKERSQHPAHDIANAMLNYAYGILYGKVESALIKAGIDPYVGLLHRDEYNRPVLVYDVIETYRVWADYVVFSLLCQEVVTDDFYSVTDEGACWLEALGRRVLIQSMNDYLDEVVVAGEMTRSRATLISLDAQSLAQTFKAHMQN